MKKNRKVLVFDRYYRDYELWFEKNRYVYISELNAVKRLLPKKGKGVEIGVGTGRFAAPLNIKTGVEPSKKMAEIAEKRGIKVYSSSAENLPFNNGSFDYALLVTTICFVKDVYKTFSEIRRVLKKNGRVIVGFVDKNSFLGQYYLKIKNKNKFYKYATFYSTEEVLDILCESGFGNFKICQTVFNPLEKIKKVETVKSGFGDGGFVVISAVKK